jgi:hypothetical protein
MKEFLLDQHDPCCPCSKGPQQGWLRHCDLNPERFLFFAGNEFFLITYYSCLENRFENKYDWKVNLIEQVIGGYKIMERWNVNRSVNVNGELRNFRIRNQSLRKHIQQVNYIYFDNASRPYAITTKTDFIDRICDQDTIDSNYIAADRIIKEKGYEWLVKDLKYLYEMNMVYVDKAEQFKTIDHLVKSINKIIK